MTASARARNRRTTTSRATGAGGNAVFSADERAFIESHRVARLATADASGAPHAVPICYALVGTAFYFVVDDKPKRTRTHLKRLRNIRQNPQVVLLIDDYDDDWSRLAYLLVQGRAAVVTDRRDYTRVLARLRRRYPQYRSAPLALATHPMVCITPERRHFWRAAAVSVGSSRTWEDRGDPTGSGPEQ